MSIEVANESGMDIASQDLVGVARYALRQLEVHPAAEMSLVLVDLDTMADLHLRWLDLPGPTDVMSFPMDELEPGGRPDSPDPGPAMLGDVVLCPEFALDQAARAGHSLDHELALLTVHGVLHLLGYDHAEPAEETEMFGLQGRLLQGWYETVRAAQLRADQAERDAKHDAQLLGKTGFTAPRQAE